jgi:hypothetical protein
MSLFFSDSSAQLLRNLAEPALRALARAARVRSADSEKTTAGLKP